MELAIPLLALGGLYVVSNQKAEPCDENKKTKKVSFDSATSASASNKLTKETFENMGQKSNYLPNNEKIPLNYPIMDDSRRLDNVGRYDNPNQSTDKYFDQNYYETRINEGIQTGNQIQQIFSLTGDYMESSTFKHNNMIPFNGGKVKGYTYKVNMAESILDNMVGSGSQTIKKIEQAPLFKPEDNISLNYGMPNHNDFFQSRVTPGTRSNNVKPFQTETVGPGLNQGYTTQGSGGFNSGMESRDMWLPKTVDELRVVTNPKLEYDLNGLQGPSYSHVQNVGILGRVEKQRPDTFFLNTPDRWLTTVNTEKGERQRPDEELGNVKRNSCDMNMSLTGPAGAVDKEAGYAPTNFEPSKRQKSETTDVGTSNAAGHGPATADSLLTGSYTNYNNNRTTVREVDTFRSGFSGAIGAAVAPLMDILRPSRKEEVTQNVRIYGDARTSVPSNYVNNPADVTSTTIKQSTMYSPTFNVNNQREQQYLNTYKNPDPTQRDSTNIATYGVVGNNQRGPVDYDAAYRQTNNEIKSQTIHNRPNQGGTQIFNQQMNVSISRQDSDRLNNRFFTPSSVIPSTPAKENYGITGIPQQLPMDINNNRNTPDILNAFRENPFTQSLSSAV